MCTKIVKPVPKYNDPHDSNGCNRIYNSNKYKYLSPYNISAVGIILMYCYCLCSHSELTIVRMAYAGRHHTQTAHGRTAPRNAPMSRNDSEVIRFAWAAALTARGDSTAPRDASARVASGCAAAWVADNAAVTSDAAALITESSAAAAMSADSAAVRGEAIMATVRAAARAAVSRARAESGAASAAADSAAADSAAADSA
eukprot:Lankesteria_metandrocarpae@DN10303_c0_g1_i1.p1